MVKSNLHYTRDITPKRVTSGGVHLRGLTHEQHSSEETSQRWRVAGDTNPVHMSNLHGLVAVGFLHHSYIFDGII